MKQKTQSFQNVGLALGSGASRGWAHIGVIKALSELDIHPKIVCGCSIDAIAGSINIAQDRITRSRLAGDPPDVMLSPKLSHIGLMEFYRAEEAIQEGRDCVMRMLPEIQHVLGK